jgi:Tfp pilus assembly protein PilN
MDRLTPLPADSVYNDHFVRPMGSDGERIAATVLMSSRQDVERARDLMAGAGLAPTVVTAQSIALCDYANFCLKDQPYVAGIFVRDGEQEYMTVCCDGDVVSSHRYRGVRDSPRAALRREVERALPDRSSADLHVIREVPGADSRSLAQLAPEGFLGAGIQPNAEAFAAVGAALGRVNEGRERINLLPAELIQPEESVGLRELGLAAAVITLAAFLAGAIAVKNVQVSSALASELSRLDPLVTAVSRQEAETRALAEKVKTLESARGASTLEYLRELTAVVPKTAYLTTFRYRNDRLEVDGIADKASELISILEKSRYFKNVEFTAPTTKYLQTKERFSLRMGLEE